jgi:hypothetical protein
MTDAERAASPSAIPEDLLTEYLGARYVLNEDGSAIRIGQHLEAVDQICQDHGHQTWLFITAYNPRSRLLTEEENRHRNEELRQMLIERGYFFTEGEGQCEDPAWKPEKSFFVPGVTRQVAIDLGQLFNQNAVVFGVVGGPAELLEMPPE